MKKFNLIATLSIVYIACTFTANAQTESKLGVFLAYGTEIENIGFGANAEFPIADKLTIAPSIIFYLPNETSGIKINWLEFNANANYYFVEEDNLGFYGIAGLNYSSVKVKYDNLLGFGGAFSGNSGRFGLNLGAGANFGGSGSIVPFAEVKYVIIDGGQLVVAGGVKFNI